MFVSAIVASAGKGVRLASRLPKPLVRINGKAIFLRSLEALGQHRDINEIILVVSGSSMAAIKRSLRKSRIQKIKAVVAGGKARSDSVRNGLKEVSPAAGLVLIHDAARPFIKRDLISRVIRKAQSCGAAVLGIPVKAAIKEVCADKRIKRTLKRNSLYEIQTPQVFRKDLITKAYARYANTAAVDDSALVERLGKSVAVVGGSYFNIKITTPEDLIFAEGILKNKNLR